MYGRLSEAKTQLEKPTRKERNDPPADYYSFVAEFPDDLLTKACLTHMTNVGRQILSKPDWPDRYQALQAASIAEWDELRRRGLLDDDFAAQWKQAGALTLK